MVVCILCAQTCVLMLVCVDVGVWIYVFGICVDVGCVAVGVSVDVCVY